MNACICSEVAGGGEGFVGEGTSVGVEVGVGVEVVVGLGVEVGLGIGVDVVVGLEVGELKGLSINSAWRTWGLLFIFALVNAT